MEKVSIGKENRLSHRPLEIIDLEIICKLPQNEEELFFMFPKAEYPLTVGQLEMAINSRHHSTVILLNEEIVGFANFYELVQNKYCAIGNVIIDSNYRNLGIGTFLIKTMEQIAVEKYNISELHLSCFNTNTKGILLYTKLGYVPYEIKERMDKAENQIALIKMKHKI